MLYCKYSLFGTYRLDIILLYGLYINIICRVIYKMENIIEKLKQIEGRKRDWDNWSLEEVKKLLDVYFIISKKEPHIFKLIYSYHECDSWEYIFRDYDTDYLENKADGVEVAINEINRQMKRDEK